MVYKSRSDVFFSSMVVKLDWEPSSVQVADEATRPMSQFACSRKSHDGDYSKIMITKKI